MKQQQRQQREDNLEPPDRDMVMLAKQINAGVKAGRVDFYGTRSGEDIEWSVIFQEGPRRQIIRLRHRPTEADEQDIRMALEAWAAYPVNGNLYTLEVPPPPASEWSA